MKQTNVFHLFLHTFAIGSKFVTLLNESKDADEALDKLFEALEK